MAMIAEITQPATPVTLGGAFAAVPPRSIDPYASPARSLAPSLNIHGPSLVVVVPDKVDAVIEARGEVGGKGGPKPLWTLGLPLPMAV